MVKRVKENVTKGIGGLTVGAVIWMVATFAQKSDVVELQKENARQWRAISELRVAVHLPPGTNNTHNTQ